MAERFVELRKGASVPEKLLSSMRIFRGRIISLRVDEVELPDGKRSSREVVEHSGAVIVIPVLSNGNIVLVRQYRHAIGQFVLELPAGKIESGDADLKECARRELLEETGYECEKAERLLEFYSSPGVSTEKMHLFVAEGLSERAGRNDCDFDEFISRSDYPPEDLLAMIARNEIIDGKTILGLLHYSRSGKAGLKN